MKAITHCEYGGPEVLKLENIENRFRQTDFMQSGKMAPVIDRIYKLSETADALRYLEQGHARGKVVIDVN